MVNSSTSWNNQFQELDLPLLSDDRDGLRRSSLAAVVAVVCSELSVLMPHHHMGSLLGSCRAGSSAAGGLRHGV